MHDEPEMIPLEFERSSEEAMRREADEHLRSMRARRSVRFFSDAPAPLEVVRTCIDTAAQAPSGANKQPWTFVLVTEAETKRRIRLAAEEEERSFYGGRAPDSWLEDLAPLGTDSGKPFLEHAPALVVVFAQRHGADKSERHYYVNESVGIACGFLITALHRAGLATLTHTPSPMGFLSEILGRPDNERAYLLLPVGYPTDDCVVPNIGRKSRAGYLVEP